MTATTDTSAETSTTADAAPSWDVHVGPADGRRGLLATGPTGEVVRLHARDCLYQRTVLDVAASRQRPGERFVEYRRRKVAQFVELAGEWWVEFVDDYDRGRRRRRVVDVVDELATGAEWSRTSPEGFDTHGAAWRTWERARNEERTPDRDLTFRQVSGRGSRKTVNAFLEGESAPVDHALGGVDSWKAAFVAEDATGAIQSVVVTHFYNPSQNGEEVCITRLANHPDVPANTSSWMLANVRDWARVEGYDRLATYAGVGHNAGICYEAAGFEPSGDAVERDGAAWTSEDDTGEWVRQKWVDYLE